jgi:signal transduction histidine kinase
MQSISQWLAGDGLYMNLIHCMGHDTFWIVTTVVLDLAVAAGYVVIAMHWWKNQRLLPDVPAKRALAHMRNIFLFCGICGYLFIPIKMVWPAWRLYDMFMVALVWFTWRYAWNARELRVVYRELGRSQELEKDLAQSRDESLRRSWFLNAVSHDLRTPLNAVSLYTSLASLKLEQNDPAGQREAIEAIRNNSTAIARMLDTLLDYASLECSTRLPNMAPFELSSLRASVIERLILIAQAKGLSLRCSLPSDLHIRTDRAMLERILDNLVSNAVKYTDQGVVRVEADVAGRDLEIHVIDTGRGISADEQGRIFDEFYQVGNSERNSTKGYGLGLAIARRLAGLLGGQITVESAPGQGSRFSVLLSNVVVTEAGPATSVIEASQAV